MWGELDLRRPSEEVQSKKNSAWFQMVTHQKRNMAFSSEEEYAAGFATHTMGRRRRRKWRRRAKQSGRKECSVHQFEEVVKQ